MKTKSHSLCLTLAMVAGLGLTAAGQLQAQTFTILHNFTALSSGTNCDGAIPQAGLILSGSTLYATAQYGGSSGAGTVFAVNNDGTGFTNLHIFTGSDGRNPQGRLLLSGKTLYGTAEYGGSVGPGTVFAVNIDGTGFTNLYSFTGGSDGALPEDGLTLSSNTLYGTTFSGGNSGNGTVFAVNTDGSCFTNLYSFTAGSGSIYDITNSDGANPQVGLILLDNILYGTTYSGGGSSYGAVFRVNTDGTSFTNLHSFAGLGDGGTPLAELTSSGNTLYGTTFVGGSSGNGTVFAVNTDGTGFTTIYNFTGGADGDSPCDGDGLILSGNTLYGTAEGGGISGRGTVFAVKTDGSGFTTLHTFTGNNLIGGSDGATPYAGLFLSGNTLYGTTFYGGSSGYGTVFSISFAPQLTIIPYGSNVILTWPTNVAGFDYTGFTLQSTTNLVSTNWTVVSPDSVVIGGQDVVFSPVSGAQQFYRLASP